MFFAPFIVI